MKWLVPTCPLLRAQTLMEYMDINHRYKNGSSPNISIVRERGGGEGKMFLCPLKIKTLVTRSLIVIIVW